jgi:nucleoside-diphosphate-sugar epimerase
VFLKIALTGATGFAGQHVLRALLARGHQVRALARDPRRLPASAKFEIVESDLRSEASLGKLVAGVDAVVHLAGAIAARSRAEFHAVNTHGTAALGRAARRAGVKRFIHVSSLAAREPQLSAYGESKRASEDVLRDVGGLLILRPPAIYGPGDRGTLPILRQLVSPIAFLPSRPETRFSLLHARDLAAIIADQVAANLEGTFDVEDGTATGFSWSELAAVTRAEEGTPRRMVFLPWRLSLAVAFAAKPLALAASQPPMISPGKIRELYHGDWVSMRGLVASQPTPFAEGFRETVAWYRNEQWLPARRYADKSLAAKTIGESAE